MTTPREALEIKVASFAILGSLKRAAAEDDEDVDENHEYTREERDRERRMRFFRPAPQLPTESTSAARRDRTVAGTPQHATETPRRVTSAPHGVIAATQSVVATARGGRLGALLTAEPGSTEGETVIPDTVARPPADKASLLRRSDSTPLPPTGKSLIAEASPSLQVGAMRKRKRGSTGDKLRPEREQVLKGLSFYYIPNDDIAPARRLRINKAREYGATWTRSVVGATHVVVDKAIEYKDVEKVLAGAGLGEGCGGPRPKVVSEDYPIDCIQFRAVLDCGQSKYRIAGQPVEPCADEQTMEKGAPPSSEESTTSLQVKEKRPTDPNRWDYVPPPGTPSRSEESSHKGGTGPMVPDDSQPVVLDLGQPARQLEETPAAAPHGNSTGPATQKDELSSYVAMMQEFKDLPLDHDDDDDDDTRSTAGNTNIESDSDEHEASETEDSRGRGGTKSRLRSKAKDTKFEDRFACNTAGELKASADNPNARTIEVLQSMADYYDRVNDHWRLMGYRKAIGTLKRQDVKICTEEEAFRLPHIGRRLAQKIEEIVTTNKLQRLEYAEKDPGDEVLQLFLGVYGAGTNQAQRWIAKGYRTLEDLAQRASLTASQRIGVEHYAELNARMPRREVEALADVVRRAAAVVDPEAELVVGGSYRRGAETCSDIDFIVTRCGTTSCAELRPLLDALVRRLEGDGFLVARLASSWSSKDGSKWHGCCAMPLPSGEGAGASTSTGPWRRIDFLLVPETQMGGALIYFTGDDVFNRSMRLLASKKGMRLNQRGLFRDPDPGGGRRWSGTGTAAAGGGLRKPPVGEELLLEGRDERRIFEMLGVRWREPHERWCR